MAKLNLEQVFLKYVNDKTEGTSLQDLLAETPDNGDAQVNPYDTLYNEEEA